MLYLCCPQPCHAGTIDRSLPTCEFLECQAIASACLCDRKKPTIDCSDNRGLASGDPANGIGWGKIIESEALT